MANRSHQLNIEFENRLIPDLLKIIDDNEGIANEPLIRAYKHIYLMFQEGVSGEENYGQLADWIIEKQDKLNKGDLKHLYDHAQNYCVRQINLGNESYLGHLFTLYKQLIKLGLIYEDQILNERDYKNIVTVATRLHAFDWLGEFIEIHKTKLHHEIQQNAYHYNMAALYYAQGNLRESMLTLLEVEFRDVTYSLGARSMLMKIYYELEDYQPLLSLLDSFRTYLRRNRLISAHHRQIHTNLVKLTQQLTKIKMIENISRPATVLKRLAAFEECFNNNKPVANENWIMERFEMLKDNNK